MRNSLQWWRVSKVFFLLIQSKGAGLFCKAPRLPADSTHPENGFRFCLSRHNRGNLFDQRKTRDCLVERKKKHKMQTERWKIIVCAFTGQVETLKIFVARQMWARMDNIFIYATQQKSQSFRKGSKQPTISSCVPKKKRSSWAVLSLWFIHLIVRFQTSALLKNQRQHQQTRFWERTVTASLLLSGVPLHGCGPVSTPADVNSIPAFIYLFIRLCFAETPSEPF